MVVVVKIGAIFFVSFFSVATHNESVVNRLSI